MVKQDLSPADEQPRSHFFIVVVDIVPEVQQPLPVHPRSKISDEDRNRLGQCYPLFFLSIHGFLDAGVGPFRTVAEEVSRQFFRLGEADASMAEVTFLPGEKRLGRRIMEVNIIAVW